MDLVPSVMQIRNQASCDSDPFIHLGNPKGILVAVTGFFFFFLFAFSFADNLNDQAAVLFFLIHGVKHADVGLIRK